MLNQSLFSSVKQSWNTPEEVLTPVRKLAPGGRIAFDPCSNATSIVKARWSIIYPQNDGLKVSWKKWAKDGLTYVNPEYGKALKPWVAKIVHEAKQGLEIVALVPSRTDTKWFYEVFWSANALCFWKGRIKFLGAPTSAPFPSLVAYWGKRASEFERCFEEKGNCIVLDA